MALSPDQENLIAALLAEKTKELAAARAGVSLTTVYRWLRNPEFVEAYRESRQVVFDNAIAILQTGARKAAKALMKALKAPKTSDQIAAAKVIFDNAFKHREFVELAERMDRIEGKGKLAAPNDQGSPADPC